MEVHPILEPGDRPSTGLWYVVSPDKPPDARVGLACVSRTDQVNNVHEILAIGGANPSATFSDVFRLNCKTFQWSKVECNGFRSRYEHAAFIPTSFSNLIYVFGGANKSGNLDCLQSFDIDTNNWSLVTYEGQSPGARTLHCVGFYEDKMYVFGGGHLGSEPVPDLKLHIFDAKCKKWSQHDLQGDVPPARHGHVMIVMQGSTLYIHGGMAGTTFYDDLFGVDLQTFKCQKITTDGDVPCARAGHSACTNQQKIFIFGGMCMQGALDDFYSYDTISSVWMALKFDCPPPAPRLDHSMICMELPVKKDQNLASQDTDNAVSVPNDKKTGVSQAPNIVPVNIWQGTVAGGTSEIQNLSIKDAGDGDTDAADFTPSNETDASDADINNGISEEQYTYVPICVVIGGMDTSGNLFNDILLTNISE